jgi:MFS family permease
MERQSLTTLFLFPVEPKQILWGKNLVVFLLGLVEISLLVLLAAFVSHAWNLVLPAFAIGIAGIGVVLGCGNYSSIFFPQRMRQIRRGFSTTSNISSESGCLRAVMSMIMLLVTLVVLIPVAVAVVVPIFFSMQWIWSFSIPASVLYGAVFYYVVTALVAPRMLERTPEILEVVARE